jgi:Ulp1 family protease
LDFSNRQDCSKHYVKILDSLHKQQKTVERRITRYLGDVWSARTPQGGKKTLEVEQTRYPTVPQQPNDKDCGLYVMKCFEQFLDFVNRDLQWSSWNPKFSHQDILSLRKKVKNTIMDEVSTK